jgi:hypothetical protein
MGREVRRRREALIVRTPGLAGFGIDPNPLPMRTASLFEFLGAGSNASTASGVNAGVHLLLARRWASRSPTQQDGDCFL